MNYRRDIDGLRAIAVMSVIAFHSDIRALPGGYVGVDVFFVISGYLITNLIYKEIAEGNFNFAKFYKRRAARLLPALSLTLFAVLAFAFIFYNNITFDNLGKELFFSSIGAANILFAQGANYFAKEAAYKPLIHLWSLGVEEQFYLVWPVVLLITFRLSKKLIIPVACTIFLVSLALSISAVSEGLTKGYFLLHYRAFELLIGAITALASQRNILKPLNKPTSHLLTYVGLTLIITPIILLDESSSFPGINALWPCIGTAIIIAFPGDSLITRLLSHKALVFIGLISYPLYLYHQPIISFIRFFEIEHTSTELFFIVTAISMTTAWLTYSLVEQPIRKMARVKTAWRRSPSLIGLCATIPFFALAGLAVAKSGGLEDRFKLLNPFALEVSQAHSTTFHLNFNRGYQISPDKHGEVLFVGDSLLQQYILPMKLALNLENNDIDTATRGGCVLLKKADFIDEYSDISCNEIKNRLYTSKKTYEYVVISQAWTDYDSSVKNFPTNTTEYERWTPMLDATLEHFSKLAKRIIIIGAHPSVEGTHRLQPSITTSEESFLIDLHKLKVSNQTRLVESESFFTKYKNNDTTLLLEPYRIFCTNQCTLTDNTWSFFSDNQHISNASTDFVKEKIKIQLKNQI